jgi:hypothetical protein
MSMITGQQILDFRLLTLRKGLQLEIKGLRKTGRSCFQIIKSEFGLRGTRQQVLADFEKLLQNKGIHYSN